MIKSTVKSMTGFGKGQASHNGRRIAIEIKTLNSKQLDLSVKMPPVFRPIEFEIRARAAKSIARGKAEITIGVFDDNGATGTLVNAERFNAYMGELRAICAEASVDTLAASILRLPDVVGNAADELDSAERAAVLTALDEAFVHLDEFRSKEGGVLAQDLLNRVALIESYVSQVEPHEAGRIDAVRERLRDQLAKLTSVEYDRERLEQELIFYLEKLDITEEKVRLRNHCSYFREVASSEENPGRKLAFIAQEMGREINTMGSKANNADIQRIVVQMKDELEKIKEQLLNLL